MKALSSIVIGLALVMTTVTTAEARHNNGLEGLLLGSGAGAIIGQAIDRSPEGVIVGSVIGGTLGLLIDLGSDRDHVVVIDNHRHHRPRAAWVYSSHWDRRRDRWEHRKHRRHERRWRQERRHHRR
ncbi:MAG: hypothetical protein ABFQ82_05975 [Thermodesulfobacteriota bacterium]